MPGNPIKFRCYKCNQLLGVSRSKVGTVVACPKCAAELLVPDPDEAPAPAPAAPSPVPGTTAAFLSALEAGLPAEGSDIGVEVDLEPEPELELVLEPEPAPMPRIPPTRAPEPLPPLVPEPEP